MTIMKSPTQSNKAPIPTVSPTTRSNNRWPIYGGRSIRLPWLNRRLKGPILPLVSSPYSTYHNGHKFCNAHQQHQYRQSTWRQFKMHKNDRILLCPKENGDLANTNEWLNDSDLDDGEHPQSHIRGHTRQTIDLLLCKNAKLYPFACCALKRKLLRYKLPLLLVGIVLIIMSLMMYRLPALTTTRVSLMNMTKKPLGDMGLPVMLDVKSLTEIQLNQYNMGWKQNAFNQYISDMIPLNRSLPDVRNSKCKQLEYPQNNLLPKTSVIVCFHNEAWSTLLRSVHSILNRSPRELLQELVLVDDYSNLDHLKGPLEEYVAKLNKDFAKLNNRAPQSSGNKTETRSSGGFIKIVRTNQREGLIRARLLGASEASGEILTFLDSHIECTQGWLEPLLYRIYRDPWTVACPVIDVISDNTFEFIYKTTTDSGQINVGGFDWNLQFNWHTLPERDKALRKKSTDPIRSPTMAGGLFSINRQFFDRLGRYDDGFEIWGGENLELSFKTWMCGGKLEILPCSHVGHIFRTRSPYQWKTGVNVLKKNSVRLAEVWMDEYKAFYYERIGNKLGDYGDVGSRIKLRKHLQCKPFSYYVREVYPELFIPSKALARGYIYHDSVNDDNNNATTSKLTYCLDGYRNREETMSALQAARCHYLGGNQYWLLSNSNEIKRDDHCLDFDGKRLTLYRCHNAGGNQKWLYSHELRQIKHFVSGLCLKLDLKDMESQKNQLRMDHCDSKQAAQWWRFEIHSGSI